MDIDKCFVKFVQFNEKTIQAIINQTVKFSTVYEFNDLNELNVRVAFHNKDKFPAFIIALEEYLNDVSKRENVISKIKENIVYNDDIPGYQEIRQYCQEITDKLRSLRGEDLKETPWSTIIEHISYIETGIFCVSKVKEVFKDDASQLMFAHYANNLQGLALVYIVGVNEVLPKKINYDERQSCFLCEKDYIDLIRGKYVDFFKRKSKNWKYECEYRFFSTPGLKSTSSIGLSLKGIFFSDRLDNEEETPKINMLKSINKKYYDDQLFIERLRRGYSNSEFLVSVDSQNVSGYLKNYKP